MTLEVLVSFSYLVLHTCIRPFCSYAYASTIELINPPLHINLLRRERIVSFSRAKASSSNLSSFYLQNCQKYARLLRPSNSRGLSHRPSQPSPSNIRILCPSFVAHTVVYIDSYFLNKLTISIVSRLTRYPVPYYSAFLTLEYPVEISSKNSTWSITISGSPVAFVLPIAISKLFEESSTRAKQEGFSYSYILQRSNPTRGVIFLPIILIA